ncbi:ADP-ribosylation/crystallin J1 [Edaphocola aurantiacus]|uniref:ADP-ribosylation/crystallin J1 n=1 Tax=Edaphocola aurantiacus TaxID=2601682 RepID=UPI001C97DF8B|nr:ADP-ribosylation/crystallin J1 [Edaphocola aurantiacus]
MKTITLYRPVGEKELLLIAKSGFKRFPPRLDWQPIFYPVLNELYASEIASQWNTDDAFGNYLGFVTRFDIVESEFIKYKVENVGGEMHNELWVPAAELTQFNEAIVGPIEIIKVFIGAQFKQAQSTITQQLIEDLK